MADADGDLLWAAIFGAGVMRTDLRKSAIRSLEMSGDKPDGAVKILSGMARKDVELRKVLVRLGASQTIRDYFGDQRRSAMTMAAGRVAANLDSPDVQKRIAGRMARVQFWDRYTIFGMTPIGDATKKMLLDSAANREAQANGELLLARFERAVAAKMDSNRATVRSCLSVGDLEKMAAKYKAQQ